MAIRRPMTRHGGWQSKLRNNALVYPGLMVRSPRSGRLEPWGGDRHGHGLILRLVDQRALLDPRHHLAQLGADLLGGMLGELGAGGLERGLVDLVLQHPVAREAAGLNIG